MVIAVAMLALTGVAAFGIAPQDPSDAVPVRTVVSSLPLPPLATATASGVFWREERVQRGDTIASVLARAGVDDPAALAFVRIDPRVRSLYNLKPGRSVRIATGDEGRLVGLRFVTADRELLSIERVNEAFHATLAPTRDSVRLTLASGEIRSSLFGTADAIGLPDAITMSLADLFAGDIDFLLDLRRGDRFSVLYETRTVEGETVGSGRILAAEFENRGVRYNAFLWKDAEGKDAWYTLDGRSTRKAFLRSPMEFTRVSSGFSWSRFHPIFRSWRAHTGTDYAAPSGTPVRATADGIVTSAGPNGGYGNAVMLRHHGSYSTVYAHLSRFAPQVRTGTRVRQGETIGYVGATGWATGPHLHYEFRINGEARNAQTVALPNAAPMPPESFSAFLVQIEPLTQQLRLARELPGARLASAE